MLLMIVNCSDIGPRCGTRLESIRTLVVLKSMRKISNRMIRSPQHLESRCAVWLQFRQASERRNGVLIAMGIVVGQSKGAVVGPKTWTNSDRRQEFTKRLIYPAIAGI